MRVFLVGLLALFTACGERRKFSLDGTWLRGGQSADHSGIIVLQIREGPGGEVTGTVCRNDSGFFIFGNLPVFGHYPYVLFDYVGGRYSGGITSPESIDGRFERSDFSQEWVFQRVEADVYERCQTARRPLGGTRSAGPRGDPGAPRAARGFSTL